MKRVGFLAFAMTFAAFCAQAATVTLQFGAPPSGAQTENGFSYINGSSYNLGGELLLHDDNGGQQSATFARVTGGAFDAVSVDMSGVQRLFLTGTNRPSADDPTGFGPSTPLSFNSFQWNGFQNGTLVASDTGSLTGGSVVNYLFNAAFSGLTSLQLSFLAPGVKYTLSIAGLFLPNAPNQAYCVDYCGAVSVDNLVLNTVLPGAVPLPSGLILFLSALLLGGAVLRRRQGVCVPNTTP